MKKEFSTFKNLIAWQKGVEIVKNIYLLSQKFPREEKFGITSQVTRAAISIPSNIAEGWGRESAGSYINFLKISRGSLYELESHLIICKEIGLLEDNDLTRIFLMIEEESKILSGLIKSIEKGTLVTNNK
jgi:four helix bundle protein